MAFSFGPAIQSMQEIGLKVWGPKDFQEYRSEHGFPWIKAPEVISIDSLEVLRPELKESGVMVLRLGKSGRRNGTQFALVKHDLNSFFLEDAVIFSECNRQTFLPPIKSHELFPFQLIGKQSETSLVNFACASELLSHALGLHEGTVSAPATGASTYTFDVMLHPEGELFRHELGQVQFDALFIGQRDGKQCLFIVEAKNNPSYKTLAKHKLVYPVLALAAHVPEDMEIIPVYLKTTKDSNGAITFNIAECHFPDPRKDLASITELKVAKAQSFTIPSSLFN